MVLSLLFSVPRLLNKETPLSPIISILVTEVLNKMIFKAVDNGLLSKLGLQRDLNNTRMIQFADDTLLVAEASRKDILVLKVILYLFENFSGMSINYAKTSFLCYSKLPSRGSMLVCHVNSYLGSFPSCYLGLL